MPWGEYLWQLGLEAGLLSQGVVDGLQEAPLHHIKGLHGRGGGKPGSHTTAPDAHNAPTDGNKCTAGVMGRGFAHSSPSTPNASCKSPLTKTLGPGGRCTAQEPSRGQQDRLREAGPEHRPRIRLAGRELQLCHLRHLSHRTDSEVLKRDEPPTALGPAPAQRKARPQLLGQGALSQGFCKILLLLDTDAFPGAWGLLRTTGTGALRPRRTGEAGHSAGSEGSLISSKGLQPCFEWSPQEGLPHSSSRKARLPARARQPASVGRRPPPGLGHSEVEHLTTSRGRGWLHSALLPPGLALHPPHLRPSSQPQLPLSSRASSSAARHRRDCCSLPGLHSRGAGIPAAGRASRADPGWDEEASSRLQDNPVTLHSGGTQLPRVREDTQWASCRSSPRPVPAAAPAARQPRCARR